MKQSVMVLILLFSFGSVVCVEKCLLRQRVIATQQAHAEWWRNQRWDRDVAVISKIAQLGVPVRLIKSQNSAPYGISNFAIRAHCSEGLKNLTAALQRKSQPNSPC